MKPRKNIDELELRRLWAADVGTNEIAVALGCGRALVSKRALEIGLPRRAVNTAVLPQREMERVYVEHGLSVAQIVKQLQSQFPTLAETTVRRILIRRGVKMRPAGGKRIDKVAECVRLARAGMECPQIAKVAGLTASQVEYRARSVLSSLGGQGRKPRLPVAEVVHRVIVGKETCVAVAADYGCSSAAVSWHVRKHRRRQQQVRARQRSG